MSYITWEVSRETDNGFYGVCFSRSCDSQVNPEENNQLWHFERRVSHVCRFSTNLRSFRVSSGGFPPVVSIYFVPIFVWIRICSFPLETIATTGPLWSIGFFVLFEKAPKDTVAWMVFFLFTEDSFLHVHKWNTYY